MQTKVSFIDSHTGGEPTRLILAGGPNLGEGPLHVRREIFAKQFDSFRSGCVNEPRGSDVLVGALLCQPHAPNCSAGVIFFNNVGMLGMCGHGTIGLLVSLGYLGLIRPGVHRVDTPAGVVTATLESPHRVCVENIPSFCTSVNVELCVPGLGTIHGDIAYGGNWFFMVEDHGLDLSPDNIPELTAASEAIRKTLKESGLTGNDGSEIDHIDLLGPSAAPGIDSRNFVLCPGLAYDRSPCGTGTSAKLACLAKKNLLQPGQLWKQESIIGSVFEGYYAPEDADTIVPTVTGEAHITQQGELIFQHTDPFIAGIKL